MKKIILILSSILFFNSIYANYKYTKGEQLTATVSIDQASQYYSQVNINLTNNSSSKMTLLPKVDIYFNSPEKVSSIWGQFPSYPGMQITSSKEEIDYSNKAELIFPKDNWAKNYLDPGESITLTFGQNQLIKPDNINNVSVIIGSDSKPVVNDLQIDCEAGKSASSNFTAAGGEKPYQYQLITQPEHGSLDYTSSKSSFTYTSSDPAAQNDSFTYKVIDGNDMESNIASVRVSITPTPKPVPLSANDISITKPATGEIDIDLVKDGYVSGGSGKLSLKTAPQDYSSDYGTAGFTGNILKYIPKGKTGIDTFSYVVNDEKGATETASVTINLTESSSKIIAGYLPVSWGTTPYLKISDVAKAGYNVVILAFGDMSKNPMQFTDNYFLGYGGWNQTADSPEIVQMIRDDIKLAKSEYGLKYVLMSVGGQNNTFTLNNIDSTAKQVVDFLDKYNLDGIDFDLETVVDQNELSALITKIKSLRPGTIITAAPQLNGINGDKYDVQLVTTASNNDYNLAITNGLFDYLFIQAYNTGSDSNLIKSNGQDIDETMVEYITSAYNLLANSSYKIKIPSKTKIVIGEPATVDSGGAATVFHGKDAGSDIYDKMADQYGSITGDMYGGAMTWEVTKDRDNNWKFVNSLKNAFNANFL